jgi:exodeoxyribonuclease VII large subunit
MENSGRANAAAGAITVSQLNREVKQLLENGLARLWVEGELSNVARPASGHVYFTLKDDAAQVRAAFFRQRQRGPTIGFRNGDQVLVFGKISLYEPRGDYQLIVEAMEPAGEGALRRQFEVLKKKLAAEGLFDEGRKRSLPTVPRCIGVITSPSGAAIRDIISVLGRRFPSVAVIVYPAAVQGEAAPRELLAALAAATRRAECDVLIIGRGGGSLEDLWAFNDETLARQIAASPIPVVSAVGHEIDFTIADFVADLRAPTPSGAAELVVPDRDDWLRAIGSYARRIVRRGRRLLEERAQTLDWLGRRLATNSPQRTLARQHERLRELSRRQVQAMGQAVARPGPVLASLSHRLRGAGPRTLARVKHRFQLADRGLMSVSPLATLERGYAIVEDATTGRVLTSAAQTAEGNAIRARLASGELTATVTATRRSDD